jgi:A/G-specific adenine glycosylase
MNFSRQITDWYRQNKRELPWRQTNNPYFIWLSEIILQQTRVNQGMAYYLKFIDHYPTITDLANADEQSVLNDWQGLGYYSRARNLHSAAKFVLSEFNGEFPSNYSAILSLKGVGSYTAAAIASFAFNLPHAVVDGNVYRVLSRVFDIDLPIDSNEGQKTFAKIANELLDKKNPGLHNQAIMEFGALHCTPSSPSCDTCPFQQECLALKNGTISERPVKKGKTKIRNRYFHYFHFDSGKEIILQKRTEKDIWQHLYEFPKIEFENEQEIASIKDYINKTFGIKPIDFSQPKKHILSHQHIYCTFWKFDQLPKAYEANWNVISATDFHQFPIPRVIDRYLEEAHNRNQQKLEF